MLDHTTEKMIPFADAAKHIPGRPSRVTLWRWIHRGVRGGHKLETFVVGSRRFTSIEAIGRFLEVQNPSTLASARVTATQRAKQNKAAREALAAIGV